MTPNVAGRRPRRPVLQPLAFCAAEWYNIDNRKHAADIAALFLVREKDSLNVGASREDIR